MHKGSNRQRARLVPDGEAASFHHAEIVLGIVLKKLNESRVWLGMRMQRQIVPPEIARPICEECIALREIGAQTDGQES